MKNETIKGYQILSDGHKVWVNSQDGCVARFCRLSSELPDCSSYQKQNYYLDHGKTVTNRHWSLFVDKVQEFFSIKISNEHRPDFIPVAQTVRLYNDKETHVLSLVQRWDFTGWDFVKPDRPGTDDGDFIDISVDEDLAKYLTTKTE